jgi:hypothetical protein
MGVLDKVKGLFSSGKAKDLAAEHGDKVVQGVDKATDLVDDKTKGKYTDKLQQVDDAAEKGIDKLQNDPGGPGGPAQ